MDWLDRRVLSTSVAWQRTIITSMRVFQRIPQLQVDNDEKYRVAKAGEEEEQGSKKVRGMMIDMRRTTASGR